MSTELIDPIAWVKTLTMAQLLEFILDHPEYISDYYYHELGNAIYARAKELLK